MYPARNGASVGASPYASQGAKLGVTAGSDLPGFFLFLVVFAGVLIFLVGIARFVKVLIFKDFVVFVVAARLAPSMIGGHGYSVAAGLPTGAAAATGAFGAGGAAPGSEVYVVQ